MVLFESFEEYTTGSTPQSWSGVNNWYGDGDQCDFYIVDSIVDHTNKIFSGDKSVRSVAGSADLKHDLNSVSDVAVRVGIWNEGASNVSKTAILKLENDNGNYIHFGFRLHLTESTGYRFKSNATGGSWLEVASVNSNYKQYHELTIYVSSTNGTSIWTESGNLIFSNIDSEQMTIGYGKMDLHTITSVALSDSGSNGIFDFLRIYKTFSTPNPFQVI